MRPIEHETSVEALQEQYRLLEKENRRLAQQVVELQRELAKLKGKPEPQLALQLAELEARLARARHALFGQSTERRAQSAAAAGTATEGKKQTGHGPRSQPELPHVEEPHELDEADRVCKQCGGALEEWKGQAERSEEITVIERRFVVVEHVRKKYRCRCGGCIETALGPVKLIPGGRYSLEFAVDAAVAKYADHLPLERQVTMMERDGLRIDSQTLFDQVQALADRVKPVYDALAKEALSAPVVHADETPWYELSKGRTRMTLWGVATERAAYYRILDSRSTDAARRVLDGFGGTLVCDGYKVYARLAREGPGPRPTIAGCWAHARRKFVEIEPRQPQACAEILDLIGQLYAVEAEARATTNVVEARARLRAERSRAIVARIGQWLYASRPQHLPRSEMGRAIAYVMELWAPLTRFLDDPRVPLDNNAAERALRGVTLGRKNHLGSKSKRGVETAAVLYSIIESCKLASVDPRAYIRDAARILIGGGIAPLPHDYRAALAA